MVIVGVDGGLAHMGIAASKLTRTRDALSMELLGGLVVETAPSPKKLGIRKGDDNMRRARVVAKALKEVVLMRRPALLVYEAQSFGMKGNIAARQAGTAFGVIAGIAESAGLPMLCVTPGDIKKAVCPELPKASKDDVILAVERLWPNVPWPAKRDNYEHLADAVAAAWACRGDEIVTAILRAEAA